MSDPVSIPVLRQFSDVFPPFVALAERSDGREWGLGSLGVWKSGGEPVAFHGRRVPTYRRGSLVCDLSDEMHFVVVPFTLADGTHASAIVLRSEHEDLIGEWTRDAAKADQVASFLNGELDALRRALDGPAPT